VTRVLLLLILQPSPQRLTPSLAQVLEKYAWAEENVNNGTLVICTEIPIFPIIKIIRSTVFFYRSQYERG